MLFQEHIQKVQDIKDTHGVKVVADIAIRLRNLIEEMEENLEELHGEDYEEQAKHLRTTNLQLKACKIVLGHGMRMIHPLALPTT